MTPAGFPEQTRKILQAMLADICVEKCGHFSVKQEITTKMPNDGQIKIKIVV